MRRQDRAISDRAEIDAILRRETVCRVAFAVGSQPYMVPLSYGYSPERHALYFHTAREGKKIDCIRTNPTVCFEVEGPAVVKPGTGDACTWGLQFESVIGYGTLVELISDADRAEALGVLMKQQSGTTRKDWTYNERVLSSTCVWRLTIERVTGKRAQVSAE